ncbi:MAG TPA: hypothetical protein DIU45_01790, partial [Clostridium sp.]|nr:hypothetical protein [Clostridium sp.]
QKNALFSSIQKEVSAKIIYMKKLMVDPIKIESNINGRYTILKPSRNPTKHIPIIIPKIILHPSFTAISPSELKKQYNT